MVPARPETVMTEGYGLAVGGRRCRLFAMATGRAIIVRMDACEDRVDRAARLCRRHGVLALYLFGSRGDDGLRMLAGESVPGGGSDLDVGVVFDQAAIDHRRLAGLRVALEELFAPLRVDLVPLARVDAYRTRASVWHNAVGGARR